MLTNALCFCSLGLFRFDFNSIDNKIACRYDAYRPLVDRIYQRALRGGGGGVLLRGGGAWSRGGCLVLGWGVVSQHALRQTLPPCGQNSRHRILSNFVCGR